MMSAYKENLVKKETEDHINQVKSLIELLLAELNYRAETHDQSKLESSEFQSIVKYTPLLKQTTYGSDEYRQLLKKMKPAIDHHYSVNKHHPEHFHEEGINGMNLVDLIEMVCDWKAATLRHNDGNIDRSIAINKERFNLSLQMVHVIKNTMLLLEELSSENIEKA